MGSQEVYRTIDNTNISLDVGFYDPFSVFQGGFRSDFEKHVKIPSFYWKDNNDTLRVLKNVTFNFIEEIPHNKPRNITYLKFMFVSCQSVDDYRAKVRPLILQWLNSNKSLDPKVPYFIYFFENTELISATDKYLKTNIFHKLKGDFDNKEFGIENLFKIKSMYPTQEGRFAVWKLINGSTKPLLSNSINLQLAHYHDDLDTTATIFQHLNQYQDALACYSKLFNLYPYIKKEDFESIELSDFMQLINSNDNSKKPDNSSILLVKIWYYKKQEMILSLPNITDVVYVKNMCMLSQTLLSFLNSMEMCYKRNEICYIMIRDFLSNTYLRKMIEQNQNNDPSIISIIGNLKLLQRNELIALGTSRDYYIKGSMSLIDIQFNKAEFEVKDKNLIAILESKNNFIDKVIDLTRDLITMYDESVINMNTIAMLSTELALILYYSTDDYETSCDQLVKSYGFFFANGWKYIGVSLLEVYIQNLDKLVDVHGPTVIFQLISSYVTLASSKSTKFDEKRFRELSSKLTTQKVLRCNDLFTIRNLSSVYCDEVDIYMLDLNLESRIHCKVDKIKLVMRNKNNDIIEFYCDDFNLTEDNKITLSCSKMWFDDYDVTHMTITVAKFEMIQSLDMKIHLTSIDSFGYASVDQLKTNTKAIVKIPSTRTLHSDKLLFEVSVGSNPIKDVELIFIKSDPDKLSKEKQYSIDMVQNGKSDSIDYEMVENNNQILFKLKDNIVIQPTSKILLNIPYFFPPDVSNTLLDVEYTCNFTSINSTDGTLIACSRRYFTQIESLLPIAVAANEIFRSSRSCDSTDSTFSIFSQFTLNSISVDNPIRIKSVELKSENSKIETWKSPKNIIVFMDQGSTFFYKISDFNNDKFLLRIEYNSIRDEILQYMDIAFKRYLESNKIEKNEFYMYHVIGTKIWKSFDYKYNFYALTQKIIPIDFNIENIMKFMKYINRKYVSDYKTHIECFIASLNTMELNDKFMNELLTQTKNELLISVNLPNINMINVVSYDFEKELQYLICEPINIKVTLDVQLLKLTRNQIEEFDASTEKKVRFKNNEEKCNEIDFDESEYIDLQLAFVDNEKKWIISGVKNLIAKVNLREALSKKGIRFEFDLTFIPLKSGKLQLPTIQVKNNNNKDFAIETDYKNTSESVLIVSELNKIIHSF